MVKITITNTTTAAEIASKLQGVGKNEKLKAKVVNGATVLYTKPSGKGSTSLLDKITKRSEQKTQLARTIVKDVMARTRTSVDKAYVSEKDRQNAKDAFDVMQNVLDKRPTGGLRVAGVRVAMMGAAGEKVAADQAVKKARPFPGAKLGNMAPTYNQAAGELRSGNKTAARDRLGDAVANAIRQNFSVKEQDAFAFSPGFAFRKHLEGELRSALGSDFETIFPTQTDANAFMREVFTRAADKVPRDKEVNANTIALTKDVNGTPVTVNYTKGQQIGSGGFAKVFVYINANDPDDKIAVKFSEPGRTDTETDETLEKVGREVQIHRHLDQQGSDAIIKFKGALRTADGRIGVAMELAPGGDGFGLMTKIGQARQGNQVSREAVHVVALTIVKKIAEGLDVQAQARVQNGDVKLMNVLFTEDGDPKLSDFGTAQEGDEFIINNSPEIINPSWQSPEMLKARTEVKEIGLLGNANTTTPTTASKKAEAFKPIKQDNLRMIKGALNLKGKVVPSGVTKLLTAVVKPQMQNMAGTVSAGGKGDAWGLGVMLLELVKGDFMSNLPMGKMWEAIEKFGQNPTNVAVGPNGYFGPSTGNQDLDDLINGLMHPDPAQRLDVATALTSPAFQMLGVGGADAKGLVKALQKGDTAGMKALSDKLTPNPPQSGPTVSPTVPPTVPTSPGPSPTTTVGDPALSPLPPPLGTVTVKLSDLMAMDVDLPPLPKSD